MSFKVKLTAGASVSAFLKLFLVPAVQVIGARGADHMD